jgi:hypothetical protein
MLDTTTTAVNSMLQRARGRLEEVVPDELTEPTEPQLCKLLDQYIVAFENADVTALEQALRADATLQMIPSSTWVRRQDHLYALHRPGSGGTRRLADGTHCRQWTASCRGVSPR